MPLGCSVRTAATASAPTDPASRARSASERCGWHPRCRGQGAVPGGGVDEHARRRGGDPDRHGRRSHAALGSAHGDHPPVAATLLGRRGRTDGVEQRCRKLLGTRLRRRRRRGRRPTSPAAAADRPHRRRPAPPGSPGEAAASSADDRRIAATRKASQAGRSPASARIASTSPASSMPGASSTARVSAGAVPGRTRSPGQRMAPRPFTSPPVRARPAAATAGPRRRPARAPRAPARGASPPLAIVGRGRHDEHVCGARPASARRARRGRVQIGASAGQRTGRDPRRGVEPDRDVTVARPARRLSELGDHQRCPRGQRRPPCARPPRSPGRSPRRAPRSTVAPRPWPGRRHGRRHPRRSAAGDDDLHRGRFRHARRPRRR